MDEQYWVKRFNKDLEILLPAPGKSNLELEDEKYNQLLELAAILMAVDFSNESRVRSELRCRLLERLNTSTGSTLDKQQEDGELSEEELKIAAGGLDSKGLNQVCSLCSCQQSGQTITSAICPNCGHPKQAHS